MNPRALLALAMLLVAACGGAEKKPESPAAPSSGAAPATPPSAASASPAPAEPAAPTHAQKKPLEIYNGCRDVVTVVFAEDPSEAGAAKRTIAGLSSSDGARRADGTQTVWLVDDQGKRLIRVHVTKPMKRVEIGASCRTLDAR